MIMATDLAPFVGTIGGGFPRNLRFRFTFWVYL